MGDEIQQMTESQVIYIMSRLRTDANNKPVFRATCNPAGKGHWLTKWIEWWLLPTGLPDPDKCGVVRYFTMRDNEMVWGDSAEELKEMIPGCSPLSFTFINANVYDNPVLMSRNPEYVAWLEGQDRETKEALLYGNWYVTKQQENYFKRKWTPIVTEPAMSARRCRGFDMAGSIKDEINKDPDYTATVLISKDRNGKYIIEHAHRLRERFHTVEQYILNLSEEDDYDIVYVIPVDAGAAGKAYAAGLAKKLAENGRTVKLHPTGNKSKLVRFRPFASVCEGGFVSVVAAPWNEWYWDELEMFRGDGKTHDDALDASVSAFWALNKSIELPVLSMPDMSVQNTTINPFNKFNIGDYSQSNFTLPSFNIS